MSGNRVALTLIAVFGVPLLAFAQMTMPAASAPCAANLQSSMLCVIPQVYGMDGLVLANPNMGSVFERASDFGTTQVLTPFNASVGTELSLTPITSSASGVIFTFDKSLGIVTRSTESFGPILSERAETLGRHRFFFAGTYQFYNFTSVDGIDLKHVPVVLQHAMMSSDPMNPIFQQDYITTQNRIDLKASEITLFGSFGVTSRMDVSVAVPILRVSEGITSAAHIVRIAPQPAPPTDMDAMGGFYHFFDINNPAGSVDKVFQNAKTASGIGDVLVRVKDTVVKGEHARFALGMDFRTPTGDATNFLGSGTAGFKPFVAFSWRSRVSPHANVGFEYNGKSILAGNVSLGTHGKLPNEFFYAVGADAAINKRLTVGLDLLGSRLSSTQRVGLTPYIDVNGVPHPDVPQTFLYRDAVNMDDFSVGFKVSPWGNFLIIGNVAFKINDPGLRARVVPMVGLSYSF